MGPVSFLLKPKDCESSASTLHMSHYTGVP